MRNVTFALVFLLGGLAAAQEPEAGTKPPPKLPVRSGGGAVAAATAAIDKADALFNAQDAKGLSAMLDKSYFGAGPTMSQRFETPQAQTTSLEAMLARGGRLTRESLTAKPDQDGDAVWYVADYTFVPKVPHGALPVHRKLRESGVLVRHGKDWKFAMTHMSWVQPDDVASGAPPSTAAPIQR